MRILYLDTQDDDDDNHHHHHHQVVNLCLGYDESGPRSFYRIEYLHGDSFRSAIVTSVFDPITCGRVSAQIAVDNGLLDPVTGAFIVVHHNDNNNSGDGGGGQINCGDRGTERKRAPNHTQKTILPFEKACDLGLIAIHDPNHQSCAVQTRSIISVFNPADNEFVKLSSAIELGLIDITTGTYFHEPKSKMSWNRAIAADYMLTDDFTATTITPATTVEQLRFDHIELDELTSVQMDTKHENANLSENVESSVEDAIAKKVIDDERKLYVMPDSADHKLSFHTASKHGLVRTAAKKFNESLKPTKTVKHESEKFVEIQKPAKSTSGKSSFFKKIRQKLHKRAKSLDFRKLEDHLFTRLKNGSVEPMMSHVNQTNKQFCSPATNKRMSIEEAINDGHVFAYNLKLEKQEGLIVDAAKGTVIVLKFTPSCRKRNVMWIAKCNRILVDGVPISLDEAIASNLINVLTFGLCDWMRTSSVDYSTEPLNEFNLSNYLNFKNKATSDSVSLLKACEDHFIDLESRVVLNTQTNQWISVSKGLGDVIVSVNRFATISELEPNEFMIVDDRKRIQFSESDLFETLQSLVSSEGSKTTLNSEKNDDQASDVSADRSTRYRVTSLSEILNDIVAASAGITFTHGAPMFDRTPSAAAIDEPPQALVKARSHQSNLGFVVDEHTTAEIEDDDDDDDDASLDESHKHTADPSGDPVKIRELVARQNEQNSSLSQDEQYQSMVVATTTTTTADYATVDSDESRNETTTTIRTNSWEAKVQLEGVFSHLDGFRRELDELEMQIITKRCPSLDDVGISLTSLLDLSESIEALHAKCEKYLLEKRRDNWFCGLTEGSSHIDIFEADFIQKYESMKTEVYARLNLLEHAMTSSQHLWVARDNIDQKIENTNEIIDATNNIQLKDLDDKCSTINQLKSRVIEQTYANLDEMANNVKNIEDDLLAVYDRATLFATHAGDFSEAAVQIIPETGDLHQTHLQTKNRLDASIQNLNDLSSLLMIVNEKHTQLLRHADELSSRFNRSCQEVEGWRNSDRPQKRNTLNKLKHLFLSHSKHLEDIRLSAETLVELLLSNSQIFDRQQAYELHKAIEDLVKDYQKAVMLMQNIEDPLPDEGDDSKVIQPEDEVPVERKIEGSADVMSEFGRLANILKTSISTIEDLMESVDREDEMERNDLINELFDIIRDAVMCRDEVSEIGSDVIDKIRDLCIRLDVEAETIQEVIDKVGEIRQSGQLHLAPANRFDKILSITQTDLNHLIDFLDNLPPIPTSVLECENEVEISQEKCAFNAEIEKRMFEMGDLIEYLSRLKAIRLGAVTGLCGGGFIPTAAAVDYESLLRSLVGLDDEREAIYESICTTHEQITSRLRIRADQVESFIEKLHSFTCSSHSAWKLLSDCQKSIDSLDLLEGFPVSLKVLSQLEDELTKLRRKTIDDGWVIDTYRYQFDNLYTSADMSSNAIQEEKRMEQLMQKWMDLGNYLEESIIEIRDQMVLIQTMDEVFETVSDDMKNRSNLLDMLTVSSSDSKALSLSLQSAIDIQNDHNDRYCLITHIYSLLEKIRARAEKSVDDIRLKEKCEQLNSEWLVVGARIIEAIERIKKIQSFMMQFDEHFVSLNSVLDSNEHKIKRYLDESSSDEKPCNQESWNQELLDKNIDEAAALIWKCREITAKTSDIADAANLYEEIDSSISAAVQRLDQQKLMVATIDQSVWDEDRELGDRKKPNLLEMIEQITSSSQSPPDTTESNESELCEEVAIVLRKKYPGVVDELVDWPMRHDPSEQSSALVMLFKLAKSILRQETLVTSLTDLSSLPNRNDDQQFQLTRLKSRLDQVRLFKTTDVLAVINRATLSKVDLLDKINELELCCQRALLECDPEIGIMIDPESPEQRVFLRDLRQLHSKHSQLTKLLYDCQQLMHRFRSDFRSYPIILNIHLVVSILSQNSATLAENLNLYVCELKELERDCLCRISAEYESSKSEIGFQKVLDSKLMYLTNLMKDVHRQITTESPSTDLVGLGRTIDRIRTSIDYTTKSLCPEGFKKSIERFERLNRDAEWCKDIISKQLSPQQIRRIDNNSNLLDEASVLYSEALATLDKFGQVTGVVKPEQLEFQIEQLSDALTNVQKSDSIIKRIRNEMMSLEPIAAVDSERIDEIVVRISDLEKDEAKVATRLATRISLLKNRVLPASQKFQKYLCCLRDDLDSAQNELYDVYRPTEKINDDTHGSRRLIQEFTSKQQNIAQLVNDLEQLQSIVGFKNAHEVLVAVVNGDEAGVCDKRECLDEIKGIYDEVIERYSNLSIEAAQYSEIFSSCLEEAKIIHKDIEDNLSCFKDLQDKFNLVQNGKNDFTRENQADLIENLNKCYECVDCSSTKRNSIKGIGNKLREIEGDPVWHDFISSINDASTKLEGDYENLIASIVDRATAIETELVSRDCDKVLIDNLTDWLNQMIGKVVSITTSDDTATIPMICAGIETRKGCFETVQKTGGQELETLWFRLKNEVCEQELNIKEIERPDESLSRLLAWIKSIEANFTLHSGDLALAGSHKVLQKQYTKFMITYNDIMLHEQEVNRRIDEQTDRLSADLSVDRNKRDKHRLSLIQSKWTLVKDRATKRKEKLENALKDAFTFNDDLQSLNDSLCDLERRLNHIGFSNRNKESLLHQQSLHDDFLDEVNIVRAKLIAGEKLGTKIRFYCRPSDAIMVRNLLFAMKRRYDKIMSRSSEKRRAIDRLLKEVVRFHTLYDQLNEWISNVIEVLENDDAASVSDHGSDGSSYQRTLDEHKLLMREIELNRPVFDQLLRQCNRWIATSNSADEKSRLKALCAQLKTNWQNLSTMASKRRQDIETSMMIQGRIEDLSANIIHWLTDLNTSLGQQISCCYGDLLTVSALCEAHDTVTANLDSAADQIDVLIGSKDHQPILAEQKRQILSELYFSVKSKIERRSTLLGHALSTAIQFDEEIKEFLYWANDMEGSLRGLRRLPDAREDLQFVTIQLGESLKQISDHQEQFNQIKDMAAVILHACHPDAVESVKECVNLTEIRLKEIVGYACELEEKLNLLLKSKLAHDKTMTELESWLKKIEDYFEGIDVVMKDKLNPEVVEDRLEQAQLVSQDLKVICGRLEASLATFTSHTMAPMIARSGTLFNLLKCTSGKSGSSGSPDPVLSKLNDLRAQSLLKRIRETVHRSTQYISKLQDWLAFKCGKEELKNFDFERWIRRNGPAIKYCRNRLLQYFRRRDPALTDRVDVEDFIIGLTSVAKLSTARSQMLLVAELFKDTTNNVVGVGECTVRFKEFLNAVVALVEQSRRGRRRSSGNSGIGGGGDRIRKEMCDEIGMCSCSEKYEMHPISEGKYCFGANKRIHLVRILRSTVMVRVGGGWVSLAEFLAKNDPCRAKGLTNQELREEFLSNSGIEARSATNTLTPSSPTLLKTTLWNTDCGQAGSRCRVHSQNRKFSREHRQSCEFPSISDSDSKEKQEKRRARSGGSPVYRIKSGDDHFSTHIHL